MLHKFLACLPFYLFSIFIPTPSVLFCVENPLRCEAFIHFRYASCVLSHSHPRFCSRTLLAASLEKLKKKKKKRNVHREKRARRRITRTHSVLVFSVCVREKHYLLGSRFDGLAQLLEKFHVSVVFSLVTIHEFHSAYASPAYE